MHFKAEVIIVGGGPAGISAAIYLARARRDVLVIDAGKSMARWEPHVQNYLGFPAGVDGNELLNRGRRQARKFGIRFVRDQIQSALRQARQFSLVGARGRYGCSRLLLA